jgi:hypothetical protein
MMRLAILSVLACLITSCDRSAEVLQESSESGVDAPSTLTMKERLSGVNPGTPRSEVLSAAGLTEKDGAKRISYYADICGSMEEWVTSTGDELYVQGHFFDQEGYREEPYIIGILRLASKTGKGDEVVWSGLNLQTGTDVFNGSKTNGEQDGAEQAPTAPESK